MIGHGWRHDELMAMPVSEFMWWFGEQEAAEKAKAEAIRKQTGRH